MLLLGKRNLLNWFTTKNKEHHLLLLARRNYSIGLPPKAKGITCSYLPEETCSIGFHKEQEIPTLTCQKKLAQPGAKTITCF